MPSRWSIPQPLPMDWPFKPLSSAKTTVGRLRDGWLELTIKHDLLRGVTREMLSWWFRRIDGTVAYHGRVVPRYRVWHPRDHIFYRDLTRDAEGGRGRGDPPADRRGLRRRPALPDQHRQPRGAPRRDRHPAGDRAGRALARAAEDARAPAPRRALHAPARVFREATGTRYESRMLVGSPSLVGRLGLSRHVLPAVAMSEAMGRAWLRHNVEEVGNFERFLPTLYERWLSGGDAALDSPEAAGAPA